MLDMNYQEVYTRLYTNKLSQARSKVSLARAQLYSLKARRVDVVSERLRWRARVRSNPLLYARQDIGEHMQALRSQSRNLRKKYLFLERELSILIENLNS